MYFKPYYLGCLAHASYLIGGDNGEAAVIDPRRDVDEYLGDAAAVGLRIRHVIETHLHADFVSGHVELARRADAVIHIGAASGAVFPHVPATDGQLVQLGDVTLRFLETPGHTPESITVLAFVAGEPAPRYAFTGDTLFIGDVGRPDLAGSRGLTAEQMARTMYRSLREKLLTLPNQTEVWPAHGAGSACGRALSEDRASTIGRERATNPALRLVEAGDEEGFVRYAVEGLPPVPAYFALDVARNREGAVGLDEIARAARPLSPSEVEELSEDGVLVLDTRVPELFGAGHVPGSINVPLDGGFAPSVGRIVAPDAAAIVVADPGRHSEAIVRLARVGYERAIGWLEGGMDAWRAAGGEVVTIPQIAPSELAQNGAGTSWRILDVRGKDEFEAAHAPGAVLLPLHELARDPGRAPGGPLAVMCGSGYRSSIACSLLLRTGRRDVGNVVGGWEAYEASSRT